MTRKSVSKRMSKAGSGTARDAAIDIDRVLSSIEEELISTGRVELRGFGSFSLVIRRRKPARNPRTGELVEVPERVGVRFRLSETITARLSKIEVEP